MTPLQHIKEIDKEFDKKIPDWLSCDPLEPQYMIPDMKAIKSHLHSTLTTILTSLVEKMEGDRLPLTPAEIMGISNKEMAEVRDTHNYALQEQIDYINSLIKEIK